MNVDVLAFHENLLIGVKVLWRIITTLVMGSKRRRWVEPVAKEKCVQVLVVIVKGKDGLEDLGVDGGGGNIILDLVEIRWKGWNLFIVALDTENC
jgi:hypothetical protein